MAGGRVVGELFHISQKIKKKSFSIQNENPFLVISIPPCPHLPPTVHPTAVEMFSKVCLACETLRGSFKEQEGKP